MSQSNLTSTPHQQFYEEAAFKPLGARLVCVIEDAELERRPSGLFLPSKDREKPLLARVIEVGSGVKEVKPRDLVIFERYSGSEIRSTNKPAVLVLDEADVLAIVEKGGQYEYERTMAKRLKCLEDMNGIQGVSGNWDYDEYMMGLTNGLILAIHTMTGAEGDPKYKTMPKKWLKDMPKLKKPVAVKS